MGNSAQIPESGVTEKGNVHLCEGGKQIEESAKKEVLPGFEPGLRKVDKSESRVITTTL